MKYCDTTADPPGTADDFPLGPFASVWGAIRDDRPLNDYDPIAAVFDEVMGFDFHTVTHEVRCAALGRPAAGRPLRILDLCCGTGVFFSFLRRHCAFTGFGIDRSRGQIGVASARTDTGNNPTTYRVADILDAEFPPNMDAVTINFDSINHLGTAADWQTTFRKAAHCLRDGGQIVFDVNTPQRLLSDLSSPEAIVKDDVVYLQLAHKPEVHGQQVRRAMDMIVFKKTAAGHYRRIQTRVRHLALPHAEILGLLRSAGFSHIKVICALGSSPQGHMCNKNRVMISARK